VSGRAVNDSALIRSGVAASAHGRAGGVVRRPRHEFEALL
jgi:hypothetical protein